jgi:putative tryptophan/tyrosine transport system substrate-binding protein
VRHWFAVFIAIAGLLTLAPMGAAEQQGKMFQIGILSPATSSSTKAFDAFRDGLRELGYVEGANIRIEYRLAAWDFGRLPAMAADLVRLPVDVIVTDSRGAAQIAEEATRTIPIVAATAGADPVAAGLATSLARPGAKLTGFTGAGDELSGKRVQLLKDAVPRAISASSNASPALIATTSPAPAAPPLLLAAASPNTPSFLLWPDNSAHKMQTLTS